MRGAFLTFLVIVALCLLCSLNGCRRGIGKPCQSGWDCNSNYCRDGVCFKVRSDESYYVPIYVQPRMGR